MRISIIAILLAVLGIGDLFAAAEVPAMKVVDTGGSAVTVGNAIAIDVPEDFEKAYGASMRDFRHVLAGLDDAGKVATINVHIGLSKSLLESTPQLRNSESSLIRISANRIQLSSDTLRGALHALTTLQSLIQSSDGALNTGTIVDYPDIHDRLLHLVIQPWISLDRMKTIVRLARFMHFNGLVLQAKNNVKFESMRDFHTVDAWPLSDFKDLVTFARQNGMEVIPEIKFLTHQKLLFADKLPELMFNKRTYDPRHPTVHKINRRIIDELIKTIQPAAIHIGHDEVHGWRNDEQVLRIKKKLPASLFLMDILKLHGYIRSKGLQTWMWADMLLSKEKFPKMEGKFLHGYEAYGELAPKLPKDIVMMDWHYDGTEDFSSITYFDTLGFKVIGSPFNRKDSISAFSESVHDLLPPAKRGMCATTWSGALRARKDRYDGPLYAASEEAIIDYSGRQFWNVK